MKEKTGEQKAKTRACIPHCTLRRILPKFGTVREGFEGGSINRKITFIVATNTRTTTLYHVPVNGIILNSIFCVGSEPN